MSVLHAINSASVNVWRQNHGLDTILHGHVHNAIPSSIKHLILDFPMCMGPVRSPCTDLCGTPPLLLQLFPVPLGHTTAAAYLNDGELYPVRLQTSAVEVLELHLTPHMFYILPCIAQSIGDSLTSLSLLFCT